MTSWFTSLKSLGEFTGIRFGNVDESSGEVEWIFIDHAHYDGIGGFAQILRERGGTLPTHQLPRIPHQSPDSVMPLVKSLPKVFQTPRRLEWKSLDASKVPYHEFGPSKSLSWHLFSEGETSKIKQLSRSMDVTVNTYLLKHLDRSIRSAIKDPSEEIPWMIPVNLRGKVSNQVDESNHSSCINISLKASHTVKDAHKLLRRELDHGNHWASWYAYKYGGKLPGRIRCNLIKADRAGFCWNLGCFSNLGEWDKEKRFEGSAGEGFWLFAPPVLEGQRLGAGCVTFRGRMSLLLQLHPALSTDPEVAKDFMQNWIENIELDLF